MCKQDDNVYIDLSVARQIIDDLFEKNRTARPDQCQCGSKKFTVERGKFTCKTCGTVLDLNQEVEEPPPVSSS
jgi:hypothetical protein